MARLGGMAVRGSQVWNSTSISMSLYLHIHIQNIYLSIYLSTYLSIYLSIYLYICVSTIDTSKLQVLL